MTGTTIESTGFANVIGREMEDHFSASTVAKRSRWRVLADWLLRKRAPLPAGISPVEFKVLVKPSDVEVDPALARAKKLGIQLPQDVLDREFMAQIDATLIAVGGNAFEDWKPPIPAVGNRVLIAKYAGITVRGADGVEYRMLNDKDISGIITKEGVSRV